HRREALPGEAGPRARRRRQPRAGRQAVRGVMSGRGARLAWFMAAAFAAVHAVPADADAQATPRAASPRPKPAPSSTFDAIVKKAAAAKEAGRYDEAIQYYREALKLKPACFACQCSRARCPWTAAR